MPQTGSIVVSALAKELFAGNFFSIILSSYKQYYWSFVIGWPVHQRRTLDRRIKWKITTRFSRPVPRAGTRGSTMFAVAELLSGYHPAGLPAVRGTGGTSEESAGSENGADRGICERIRR